MALVQYCACEGIPNMVLWKHVIHLDNLRTYFSSPILDATCPITRTKQDANGGKYVMYVVLFDSYLEANYYSYQTVITKKVILRRAQSHCKMHINESGIVLKITCLVLKSWLVISLFFCTRIPPTPIFPLLCGSCCCHAVSCVAREVGGYVCVYAYQKGDWLVHQAHVEVFLWWVTKINRYIFVLYLMDGKYVLCI